MQRCAHALHVCSCSSTGIPRLIHAHTLCHYRSREVQQILGEQNRINKSRAAKAAIEAKRKREGITTAANEAKAPSALLESFSSEEKGELPHGCTYMYVYTYMYNSQNFIPAKARNMMAPKCAEKMASLHFDALFGKSKVRRQVRISQII